MKRILITGSNGLVGQTLLHHLLGRSGIEIMATSAHENRYPGLALDQFSQTDLQVPGQTAALILDFKPDAVIHAAAMTQADPCELNPDLCDRINIEGTREVARASEKVGSYFVFLSTDYVFDGLQGPYREEDEPNPVSSYGWSKLRGEYLTRRLATPWTIIRTILVYGVVPALNRSNLVLWVRNSLSNGISIRVVNDQFRMPTLADDLAEGIITVILKEKTGIYHLSGPEMLCVSDIAYKCADFFSLDRSLICPVSSLTLNQPGKRPPSTGFVLDKAARELDYAPKNLEEGLSVVQNLLVSFDQPERSVC